MCDLIALLNKKLLIDKEFTQIKSSKEIDFIECCGKSGEYNNYTSYNVVLLNGSEHSIYTK